MRFTHRKWPSKFTLISISRLDQAGYTVTFNKRVCTITDPKGKTIATIPHVDGMYKIATTVSPDINDATRQTKLYVPEKKRKLVSSYRKDKAYVETQSGNRIKTSCSDRGVEFITGKPASQARNGRFVRYNSKPKGYRKTHQPIKGSIRQVQFQTQGIPENPPAYKRVKNDRKDFRRG